MLPLFLEPGCAYSFLYPRHNYRQLPTTAELRRIEVVSLRDVRREPLDPVTRQHNPLLKRGRWLVTGHDLDKDAERTFYLESMTNVRCLSVDELHPLKDVEYVVLQRTHVVFTSQRLAEALAFRSGRKSGAVCSVLFRESRELPPVSILDEPPIEFPADDRRS